MRSGAWAKPLYAGPASAAARSYGIHSGYGQTTWRVAPQRRPRLVERLDQHRQRTDRLLEPAQRLGQVGAGMRSRRSTRGCVGSRWSTT